MMSRVMMTAVVVTGTRVIVSDITITRKAALRGKIRFIKAAKHMMLRGDV